jgi:hypothetical protein
MGSASAACSVEGGGGMYVSKTLYTAYSIHLVVVAQRLTLLYSSMASPSHNGLPYSLYA